MILGFLFALFLTLPGFGQEGSQPFDAHTELRKVGYTELGASSLLDPKVVAILVRALEESPLHRSSRAEVRALILESVKGTAAETIFRKFPKALDVSVDFVRDPKAMAGFLRILLRKKDLELFLIFCLGVLVLAILVERFLFPETWTSFQRFLADALMGFGMIACNGLVFYLLFKAEVAPALRILSSHL